jgi:hypothetical protein
MPTRLDRTTVPVTASWSTALPPTFARIGISRGSPRRQRGYRLYSSLAPGAWFNSVTPAEYLRLYMAQLAELDPPGVLADLGDLAGGRVPALLCFEPPPPNSNWCHRGLVSAWFADTLGLRLVEYGHPDSGWGWTHPKLPADWQRSP